MTTKRELQDAISREVSEWPDATVEFADGAKHPKAKIKFGGKQLFVPFPATSGSVRIIQHTVADVRRTLRKLGAVRPKPEPTPEEDEKAYSKPNDGAAKRKSPVKSEPTPVKPDVAGQLVAVGAITPTEAEAVKAEAQAAGSAETYEKRREIASAVDQAAKGHTERAIQAFVGEGDPEPEEDPDNAANALMTAFMARVAAIVDGIYFGLPDDVYHAVPRLSSSGLQRMCVSPGNFWRGSWLDPDRPDHDAEQTIYQVLGKAYHCARLEPHLFEATYVRDLDKSDAPKGTLMTGPEMAAKLEEFGLKKSGSVMEQAERLAEAGFPEDRLWPLIKRQWENDRNGRTPIPPKNFDAMVTDMERIQMNSQIAPLLTGGEPEVSIFWTDEYGVQMKARVDYLTRDWWADFKTFDNSRGKNLNQCLSDAVRYNRYYIQAVTYRDAVEAIRTGNLPIIEAQTEDQRDLVAAMQIKPGELRCWYIFQEKGGIPNLLAREFPFYSIPYSTLFNEQITGDQARRDAVREASKQRTLIHMLGQNEVLNAKKQFVLYSEVYQPGEPWFPIDAIGAFSDDDFHPYWLTGDLR